MPKKLKQAKPLKTPEFTTPERIAAGAVRVHAAREHLQSAREQLDAACRDLSDVLGGSDYYHAIAEASNTARDVSYVLEQGIEDNAFAAAGKYENEVKHRSCGGTKP